MGGKSNERVHLYDQGTCGYPCSSGRPAGQGSQGLSEHRDHHQGRQVRQRCQADGAHGHGHQMW